MKIERYFIGDGIFWGTVAGGMVLYFFSAPSGLPWCGSTHAALAWSGVIEELPAMPNPVWGHFVQVFGGHFVALSSVAAAIAGGLVGAMANRYFGWRVGAAAALTWLVLPPVWDNAIIGSQIMFWTLGVVAVAWGVNAAILMSTRRARTAVAAGQGAARQEPAEATWRGRINRIAAWTILGAAVFFAAVSVGRHDYRFGEAASAYARTMLAEAGDRIVVMNGAADDQMAWEAERRVSGSGQRLVAFRNDSAYRTQFVARVRREWPAETNLWVAAQVGPAAFADAAIGRHPDRIYVMTGQTTTPEKWAARWEAMTPYLKSGDRFVPVLRRAFAYEANTLGNRLQEEGRLKEAWALYWRVVEEIDWWNASAWVNLSEMLRRGYATDAEKRQRIKNGMAALRQGLVSGRAATIMAACGPVMRDSKVLEEYQAEIRKRLARFREAGLEPELPPELKSLVEWNDEMLKAHDLGDLAKAARIARTILSRPEWRGFVPANAVMGTVMAVEGDYVASEAFYRLAVAGKAKPNAAVCNDYAETLRRLRRFDEAERFARLAVGEREGGPWLYRLTLAQILRDAGKNPDETRTLVDGVLKAAPAEACDGIRREFGK